MFFKEKEKEKENYKEILNQIGWELKDDLDSLSNFEFLKVILDRTQSELNLNFEELELVKLSLLDFFMTSKHSGYMEMINKNADHLWHNFLLDTKAYISFYSKYMGIYMHHNPCIEEKTITKIKTNELIKQYRSSLSLFRDREYFKKRQEIIEKSFTSSIAIFFPLLALNENLKAEEDIENQITKENLNSKKGENISSCSSYAIAGASSDSGTGDGSSCGGCGG